MRKVEFTVPADVILEFAEEMTSKGLSNEIIDITDEDELIIEISYGRDESEAIDELEEHLDKLVEESEDND